MCDGGFESFQNGKVRYNWINIALYHKNNKEDEQSPDVDKSGDQEKDD